MQVVAAASEADALATLGAYFDALSRALAVPVEGLRKRCLVRFELGAPGDAAGWVWELRAAPDAAGGVTSPGDAGGAASETADVTISCTLQHFLEIASGRLKPAAAMLRGLIRVRGDRGLFVALRAPLAQAAKEHRAATKAARPAAAVRVEVLSVSTVSYSGQLYACYLLQVAEGGAAHSVTRRWRQLKALDRALRREPPVLAPGSLRPPPLPRLPSSTFTASLAPAFLSRRAACLSAYLNAAVARFAVSLAAGVGPAPLLAFLSPADVPPATPPSSIPSTPADGEEEEEVEPGEGFAAEDGAADDGDGAAPLRASGPPPPPLLSLTALLAGPRVAVPASPAAGDAFPPRPRKPSSRAVGPNGAARRGRPRRHAEELYERLRDEGGAEGGAEGELEPPAASRLPRGALMRRLLEAVGDRPVPAEPDAASLARRKSVWGQLLRLEAEGRTAKHAAAAAFRRRRPLLCGSLALAGPMAALLAAAALGAALAAVAIRDAAGAAVAGARAGGEGGEGAGDSGCPVAAAAWLPPASSDEWRAVAPKAAAALVAAAPLAAEMCGSAARAAAEAAAAAVSDGAGSALDVAAARPVALAAAGTLLLGFVVAYRMFGRVLRIWLVALVTILSYYVANKVLKAATRRGLSAEREEALLSSLHLLMAPWLCRHLVGLRSVFVKFGQYISGRTDMVPPEWAASLALLQDDLPPSPAGHLRDTARSELGFDASEIFESLDAMPVASASIGQVHIGRLAASGGPPETCSWVARQTATSEARAGGQGVGGDAGEDRAVLKLQHRGVDSLMRRDMVSALRIARLMQWLDPRYSAFHTVLAAWEGEMFAELDFRTEARNLRQVQLNLRAAGVSVAIPTPLLASRRCLVMTFEEGFKITDSRALALHGVDANALMSRVISAYAQCIFVDGFFNADPHAGNLLVRVPPHGGEAMPVLLDFGMTVRLTESQRLGYARLAVAAHEMDVAALRSAVTSLGLVNSQSGDMPDRDLAFWRFFMRDTAPREQAQAETKGFFKERSAQRKQDKSAGRTERVNVQIPSDLIFFWRVIGLLRGLCTSLAATVPLMELLAARAKIALAATFPQPQHALRLSPPPTGSHSHLASRLHAIACRLAASNEIGGGVSIAVVRDGKTLAAVAAGFCAAADPRPVTMATPMPLLELSSALPALLLRQLEASGVLRLDSRVAAVWPQFSAAGKGGVTVAEVLGRRVEGRLELESGWMLRPEALLALSERCEAVAAAAMRAVRSGGESEAHAEPLIHGWLLAGIAAAACGVAPRSNGGAGGAARGSGRLYGRYADEVVSRLLRPLGLEGSVWPGELPPSVAAQAAAASVGFGAQLQRFGPAGGEPSGDNGEAGGEGGGEGGGEAGGGGLGFGGGGGASRLLRELPISAGVANLSEVRAGLLPGLGAFATAEGMARLLAGAASGLQAPSWHVAASEVSTLFGERRWAEGLQLFERRGVGSGDMVGLQSAGGSLALCCPHTRTGIAILLNGVQLGCGPTRELLGAACEELGLGTVDVAEGGLF